MNKKVKSVLNFFLGVYTLPANIVLRALPTAKMQGFFKAELFTHLYCGSEYGILSFYPKSTELMQVCGTQRDFGDVAIVLQGSVTQEDHFTVTTVKMYKQFYKNVTVIVSTWADTPEKEAEALRDAGAIVLLNEYPKENYSRNLNLQLTTSLAGVKKAQELQAVKYVWKTRTDQRYYNPCALSLLLGRHQAGRLTVPGAVNNAYARYPFFLSDFMAFGEINEMEELYSCPFETAARSKKKEEILASPDYPRLHAEAGKADTDCRLKVPPQFETDPLSSEYPVDLPFAEMTICWQYFIRKMNAAGYDTFSAAYEDFLRRHIIVVDASSLGYYWFKERRKAWYPNYYQREGKLDMARYYAMFGPNERQSL